MAEDQSDDAADAMFERALELAEKHLEAARAEAADLAPYMAVAMLEVAANEAVTDTSPEDVIGILRDLAEQIEQDLDDED